MEKLCLNPAQADAVSTGMLDGFDASGMLDTVRGMVVCASLADALAVIQALEAESQRAIELLETSSEVASSPPCLRLERSKNRFRNPSSGGWMDCLINVRIVSNT